MIKLDTQLTDKPLPFLITAAAFDRLKLSGEAVVELEYVTEKEIQKLNLKFRNLDAPTDVLSFPIISLRPDVIPALTKERFPLDIDEEDRVVLGSIVICPFVAAKNAHEYGHTLDRELSYLFIHGLLHLFGYDHQTEEDRKIMHHLEEEILTAAGVK